MSCSGSGPSKIDISIGEFFVRGQHDHTAANREPQQTTCHSQQSANFKQQTNERENVQNIYQASGGHLGANGRRTGAASELGTQNVARRHMFEVVIACQPLQSRELLWRVSGVDSKHNTKPKGAPLQTRLTQNQKVGRVGVVTNADSKS